MGKYKLVISTVEDYEAIIDVVKEERIKVRNAIFTAGITYAEQQSIIRELNMIDHYLQSLDKRKKEASK